MSLHCRIERKPVGIAGDGLFATDAVQAGSEIFSVEHPLAYVLDSPHIQDTCASCLRTSTSHDEINIAVVKLKRCMGCKTARYCGEVG